MKLSLDFLSQYRTELMGFAIFWIFFYHTGVNIPVFKALFSVGWIGVEIFFLVSGFGLCSSLTKNPNIIQFYKRRFIRIIPTWWFILGSMHVVGFVSGGGVRCPHSIWECVQWYTGIGWWIGGMYFEWYMPTLILFYLLSPFINKLNNSTLLLCFILSVIAGVLLHAFGLLEHIYMSYQRIPVFLMGFILYRKYRNGGININKLLGLAIIIVGIVIFGYAYIFKDTDLILSLEMRRYSLLLFLVPLIYVITFFVTPLQYLKKGISIGKHVQHMFYFLGTISMEIYLLHINHNYSSKVTDLLGVYMNGYFVNVLWFSIVVIAAFLTHKIVKVTMNNYINK